MKRALSLSKKRDLKGLIFVAPFAVGMLFFFLIPLIQSLIFSFGSVGMNAATQSYLYTFQGIENYQRSLFFDIDFLDNLIESVSTTVANVFFIVVISFLIAILLKPRFPGRGLYRVLFFLPVILTSGIIPRLDELDVLQGLIGSETAVGDGVKNNASDIINMSFLTDLFDSILTDTGINLQFITDAVANIIVIVNSSGIQILIFLAALQTISPSLYEAANVEGATTWESFWKITVPMISPQILVVVIYSIIDSFMNVNNKLMQLIYQIGFINFNIGYAASMSWIYFAVVAVIIGVVYIVMSRFVFYQSNER